MIYTVELELYTSDDPITVTVSTDAESGVNCDADIFANEIEDELQLMGYDIEDVAHWEIV